MANSKSIGELTRTEAVKRLIVRYKSRAIDPVVYALLNSKERISVLTGKPYESPHVKTRAEIKALSVDKRSAIEADLHSGNSMQEIADKHGVSVHVVCKLYTSCFKKKTYVVRVR